MNSFSSLTLALDGWFDKELHDLPDELRQRVEEAFFPITWDILSADQRHSTALQWDYQNDPAAANSREFWWGFFGRMDTIKGQIAKWESTESVTIQELGAKETRILELRQELFRLGKSAVNAPRQYVPSTYSPTEFVENNYTPYPDAFKRLAGRIQATPAEMAAWVGLGPKDGGLAAYTNADELTPPPRFEYQFDIGADYIAPLMGCWFRKSDIAQFIPADRYITGKELLERWSDIPGLHPEAFIRAKIAESRLHDMSPLLGKTQGFFLDNESYSHTDSALFALSDVFTIEAADFGTAEEVVVTDLGSEKWRTENARRAANALHNKLGGSRDKAQQMREIWASGKYASRDRCAEEECADLGMSFSTARKALINTPKPKK